MIGINDYKRAISEIYGLQEFAIKMGLDNIAALMERSGRPHLAYPVIHVAGTNGKGSTSFFIAKILQYHGLKVGLYTSPHLTDYRERITVNGQMIAPQYVTGFWQETKAFIHEKKATFFDVTTALAFNYFRDCKVEVAVIETGLGGRLDSTNIVEADIVVLTPIDFDHEKQLGSSLRAIAAEKAAIIKKTPAIFSAFQQSPALEVIQSHLTHESHFYYTPEIFESGIKLSNLDEQKFDLHDKLHKQWIKNLRVRQIGNFQLENIALAYQVCRSYLASKQIDFRTESLREALESECWAGRLQRVHRNPDIFFDVSHNRHGISTTLRFIGNFIEKQNLIILLALLNDKDYQAIAGLLSQYSGQVIVTEVDTPRKLAADELAAAFNNFGIAVDIIKDAYKAFDYSKTLLGEKKSLLVMGSHYLIGALTNNKII
jgi:dihydrofolate synthase/folylpolyglutamate synthase